MEVTNTTFNCICVFGWTGIHCETKINYCANVTCLNRGVCWPLLGDYKCECLDNSFSGRHCEITATRIVVRRSELVSWEQYAATLLHESIHAKTGYDDRTLEFESALSTGMGNLAAAVLASTYPR